MEAIAAVASFIAIGQALAAIPKIIEVLRSLVEIRQEIIQLVNEVELLNTFGILIRETIQSLPDDNSIPNFRILQPTLLKNVEADLVSIVSQLEQLAQECEQGKKKNGQIKISRIKWLQHKRKIASLSERAKRNRDYLQLILSCNNIFASTSNGRMLVDIHAVVTTRSHTGNHPLLPFISPGHRIHEIESHSTDSDGYRMIEKATDAGSSLVSMATLNDDSRRSTSSSFAGNDSLQEQAFQDNESLIQMTATLRRVCPKKCACQCHWPTSRTRRRPAISPIYGWLGYAYNSLPQLGMRRCDVPTCQRANSPVHLNLRFPLSFCSRALEVRLSFDAVAGVGASLHLRVARAISISEHIWHEVRYGKIERVRLAVACREVSPIDGDERESILDYALMFEQYEIVLMLLEESVSILRGSDFGRRAAMHARQRSYPSLNDKRKHILQKVIALDDENAEDHWPIHEAAHYGGDLTAVLKQSTEGINTLDNFGNTPLHWAVREGDSTAIQTLIHYGANPNIQNIYTYTPLMLAALNAELDCAESLISGGCDVNVSNPLYHNAVFMASQSNCEGAAKMVSLLINHGAQLTRNSDGNALHWLALDPTAAETEEKFQIFVRAGVDLREKDEFDCTPLMRALIRNHKVMLRLLLDAGCEFDGSPNVSNALVRAALFSDAECMDILEETKFTVDVRVRDEYGDTPLDTFEWRRESDRSELYGDIEPPSDDDVEAFEKLLQGVRDRYLTAEIQALEAVIQHLKEEESTLAREALQPIIREKIHWNIPAERRTFRAIDLQIKEGMTEAAIESLEEFIEVSRERIGIDPFEDDYCSKYGLMDEGVIVEDST